MKASEREGLQIGTSKILRNMATRKTITSSSVRDEQRWQAESDASTMATYQEIMADKARMNRAIRVAKSKAQDLTKRANAMQSMARTKSSLSKRK